MNHYKEKSVRLCRFMLSAVFFCLLLSAWPEKAQAQEKIMIYFYSSETNINNFKSLKMEFDTWLSRFGPYEFQPFSDRQIFETHLRGKKDCLVLLSSWHFSKIAKEYSLSPLLSGIRNGKKYQKRILVAAAAASGADILQKGPVASASNPDYTRSVLRELFGEEITGDSVRILTVPKDIDALMSVGFEMSKSALITESTLEKLKETDPVLSRKMKTLKAGKDSLLLILAVPESFSEKSGKILEIIQNMSGQPEGADIVRMLDLDGWEPVGASERSKLEG